MLLHADARTQKRFYTQTPLHTATFTHRHVYRQAPLHTEAFSHADAFTHGRVCTHTHTLFLHRGFYTQTFLHTHTRFYTQRLLHTDTFTHSRFYTQTLSHWRSYTPALLRTDAFTPDAFAHRNVETRTLWHTYIKLAQSTSQYYFVLQGELLRAAFFGGSLQQAGLWK